VNYDYEFEIDETVNFLLEGVLYVGVVYAINLSPPIRLTIELADDGGQLFIDESKLLEMVADANQLITTLSEL